MSEEHGHGDIKFMIGFFLGGILGALTIFFLGTKEGKKVGKELKEKGENLLDDVTGRIEDFEEKGKEVVAEAVEEGKVATEQLVQDVKETKNEMTTQAAVKIDETLSKIETIQEQSLQQTADLRKRLFKNLPPKKR